MVGCEDSRDVADHDACNALNRLLSLVVYPRNDRRARRRRVVIRGVVAGKRAGVAVPTRAARNSQTKGGVTQEWDAVDEIVVGPAPQVLPVAYSSIQRLMSFISEIIAPADPMKATGIVLLMSSQLPCLSSP